jgi:hypothetical protein
MRSIPRALAVTAIAWSLPLSIFIACGSSTFSSDDSDASSVSPQNDASAGDSQATASDASTDADAAPPPPTWCQTNAPNALFCADFDESDISKAYVNGVLQPTLTKTILDGGVPGTILALGTGGESAPGALMTALPIYPGNEGAFSPQATVDTSLPDGGTTIPDAPGTVLFRVDFDLRMDAGLAPI